jgi:hypothetical protein
LGVDPILEPGVGHAEDALARHRAGVSEVEQRGSIDDLGLDA